MCLISDWRFPKKAKENIVCYKSLKYNRFIGEYTSPYRHTIITIPSIMKAKGNSWSLSKGADAYEKRGGYIHAYTTLDKALRNTLFNNYVIVECIIPKGTKYHLNTPYEEICAKEIKINKIVFKL